jgi:hypothetical protein
MIVAKEEELLFALKRQVQMRELDLKNFATVESSLKQEIK